MDFACSRCGGRQAEDTTCGGCGNIVVQDLRSANARRMLYDVESRWQRARHGTFVAISAAVGVVLWIGLAILDSDLGLLRPAIALSVAVGITIAFEATLGKRRKFPYLDDYEYAPAAAPAAADGDRP